MIFEIILTLIIGILFGTLTGLIPGIHINLISLTIISSSFLLSFSPLYILIFIISMTITHTFLDFIPSIFLGSPDEDTGLSVLPGHHLLLNGEGYQAVIYSLYGSCLAILIILILSPIFLFILPNIFSYFQLAMFFILLFASVYLIIKEQNSKLWAVFVFLLSGFLGISTLNININHSLLPLLTGLFGGSSLITSIIKKQKIPKQKISPLKKPKLRQIKNPLISSILSAPLCSFLPSLGSSQAAVIGSDLISKKSGKINKKEFLILLGSINTLVSGLAFITLLSINKARTGTSLAIKQILSLNYSHLYYILPVILISGVVSFFLTIFIAKIIAKNIHKFNYKTLSIFILIFLSIISFYFSTFLGLLIFIISSFTGLIAILVGIRRTHLMGSLMIPTLLLYFPL